MLQRKHVEISHVVHIGKETNTLDTELNSDSYVVYENRDAMKNKFRELAPKILELRPSDVKDYGVFKQTCGMLRNT